MPNGKEWTLAEGAGFEPAVPVLGDDALAVRWFKPLTQPSMIPHYYINNVVDARINISKNKFLMAASQGVEP